MEAGFDGVCVAVAAVRRGATQLALGGFLSPSPSCNQTEAQTRVKHTVDDQAAHEHPAQPSPGRLDGCACLPAWAAVQTQPSLVHSPRGDFYMALSL